MIYCNKCKTSFGTEGLEVSSSIAKDPMNQHATKEILSVQCPACDTKVIIGTHIRGMKDDVIFRDDEYTAYPSGTKDGLIID